MTPPTAPDRTSRSSSIVLGAPLIFETLVAGDGEPAARLRPDEDTLLRVISGVVRLTTDRERLLGAGDEVVIAAGTPHRLACDHDEALVVIGFARR